MERMFLRYVGGELVEVGEFDEVTGAIYDERVDKFLVPVCISSLMWVGHGHWVDGQR